MLLTSVAAGENTMPVISGMIQIYIRLPIAEVHTLTMQLVEIDPYR